jgi:hypothetical protein
MYKFSVFLLAFLLAACCPAALQAYNTFQSADVVVGQPYMNWYYANANGSVDAQGLNHPTSVCSDGTHMFVVDTGNNRVLVYNTIPGSDFASANVVVGQPYMNWNYANVNGSVEAQGGRGNLAGDSKKCSC